jgi:hypothetical protein
MKNLNLSDQSLQNGIWRATYSVDDRPEIVATHLGKTLEGVEVAPLNKTQETGPWTISVPIPSEAIADGVQTILVRHVASDEEIASIHLVAGNVLENDLRAEVGLLRAELNLLKRAFRRQNAGDGDT